MELPPNLSPFTHGFDLFNDQLITAIHLPGHAKGQISLYFKTPIETFLVADSCWHQEAFKELAFPSNLTYLMHDNKETYQQTIRNLHHLFKNNKDIDIIPAHCQHIRARLLETHS